MWMGMLFFLGGCNHDLLELPRNWKSLETPMLYKGIICLYTTQIIEVTKLNLARDLRAKRIQAKRILQVFSRKWGKARLCSCSNPFQHALFRYADWWFQEWKCWHWFSLKNRWWMLQTTKVEDSLSCLQQLWFDNQHQEDWSHVPTCPIILFIVR